MANIFGSPFRGWVTKQIQTRQNSLGYQDYGVDDLKYQNTKVPWIRLASSVDITGNDESQIVRSLLKSGVSKEVSKKVALYTGAVMTEYIGLQGRTQWKKV